MSKIASRPDEVNNIHETSILTMNQDTETTRKSLSIFKVITCGNLKSMKKLRIILNKIQIFSFEKLFKPFKFQKQHYTTF